MPSSRAFFERRAQEERARAASCGNPIVAAAFRRRAEALQRRANAQFEDVAELL
ncbi:hypothetical protein [Sphingomonas azotifigens]|uniref:hypothetical protein n=1 Tax=Sphingomonas azotifigens TaxID=330920 RepID=UPI00142FE198|nr:hypothetical protein [Sphingomonas azotifigens]